MHGHNRHLVDGLCHRDWLTKLSNTTMAHFPATSLSPPSLTSPALAVAKLSTFTMPMCQLKGCGKDFDEDSNIDGQP
jgi:hypothetical protein